MMKYFILVFFGLLVFGIHSASAGERLDINAVFSTFDQVNGFDIDTASLGVVEGHSKEVRKLAAMVLRDHSMVIQMGRNLAQNKGIEYAVDQNNESAQEHQAKMENLKKLSGKAFDQAYLQHEIKFHSSAIQAVKTILIPSAHDQDLKELLQAVLPGFQHHLEETKRVAKLLQNE